MLLSAPDRYWELIDHVQGGVLYRRQPERARLLEEHRNRDLVHAPDQMAGARKEQIQGHETSESKLARDDKWHTNQQTATRRRARASTLAPGVRPKDQIARGGPIINHGLDCRPLAAPILGRHTAIKHATSGLAKID
jgi:hypothetical protein